MTRKDALAELIAKLGAEVYPSQADWFGVFPDTPDDDDYPRSMMAVQASVGYLDAAKALHESVLHERVVCELKYCKRYDALVRLWDMAKLLVEVNNADPARAWLLAILRALHAQEAAE